MAELPEKPTTGKLEIAALSTLGVAFASAVLYSFGIAYKMQFLYELGFDPAQFPIDFKETMFWGGWLAFAPVLLTSLYIILVACVTIFIDQIRPKIPDERPSTVLYIVAAVVFIVSLLGTIEFAISLWNDPNRLIIATFTLTAFCALFVSLTWKRRIVRIYVINIVIIFGLWYAWFIAQLINIGFASKDAQQTKENIRNKPCDIVTAHPRLVLELDTGKCIRPLGGTRPSSSSR